VRGTTVIVEIRSGEGGKDAKLLVYEQYDVYRKLEGRRCL
jgi:protein subunit release factor A